MTRILAVTTSLAGPASDSTALVERYLARRAADDPTLRIRRRDLHRQPVPALDATRFAALTRPAAARSEAEAAIAAESDALVDELSAADVVLIAAPMYNFGVPVQLKSWFDHVARAGVTFRYTATGPMGLLRGKRAVLVTTRGGRHRDAARDHVVPWVRTMLAFLGIVDLEVIYAEGLALGVAEREDALAAAAAQIDALTATAQAA